MASRFTSFVSALVCYWAIITLYVIHQSTGQHGFYPTKTSSRCFSTPGIPRLDLNRCAHDTVILIREAIQGISLDPRQCYYHSGDCVQRVPAETELRLREACIGQQTCSITVGVSWLRTCTDYSTYNFVVYQCIPNEDVLDICEQRVVSRERVSFIKSPRYPQRYDKNLSCQCNISTERTQKILIQFPDCDLSWSEGCREDVIEIEDNGTVMSRCGQLPTYANITSESSQIVLRFRTDESREEKGFIIAVEALGHLDLSCGEYVPVSSSSTTAGTTSTTELSTPSATTVTKSTAEMTELDGGTTDTDIVIQSSKDIEGLFVSGEMFPTQDFSNFGIQYTEDIRDTDIETESNKLPALFAIAVGVVLTSVLILVGVFVIIWIKKRTHSEQISKFHDNNRHQAAAAPSRSLQCQPLPSCQSVYVSDNRNCLTSSPTYVKAHGLRHSSAQHSLPKRCG